MVLTLETNPIQGSRQQKEMQADTERATTELLAVGDVDHFPEEELLIPGLGRTVHGLQTELTFI